jgi:2-succinyl-5-enolpyruvyl-6-hydroxy-3-cyclohexene-1-carboxylate synthase
MLKGLEQSPVRDSFISGAHHTTAQGICKQNNIRYMKATNMEEMQQCVDTLLNKKSTRPVLLEIFTDADEDERVVKTYYQILKNEKLANDKRV